MEIETLTTFLTSQTNPILMLAFFTALIVIYATFIFYFYRFLAKKNLIELNLAQYNTYASPFLAKIVAIFLFIIEYIILLPVMTFFWFATLSVLILVLAEELGVDTILMITAALVASVRITAYLSEDLSRDLAKMIPFTMLTIAFTTAGFFDPTAILQRISEIPTLFTDIPYYLLFIVAIETIMRFGTFLQSLSQPNEALEETETEEMPAA